MTRDEAIERLASAREDDADLVDEAEELFAAIYGRTPDADDGDAGQLISLCYACPDVVDIIALVRWSEDVSEDPTEPIPGAIPGWRDLSNVAEWAADGDVVGVYRSTHDKTWTVRWHNDAGLAAHGPGWDPYVMLRAERV